MSGLVWLIIAVVLFAFEAATPALISIWFAIGAVITMIFALLGVNSVIWQAVIFIISSSLILFCTRKYVRKSNENNEKTNVDSLIGRTAIVSGDIDNMKATGEIKIDGLVWTARASGDDVIPAGSKVRITHISGVKLIVEPIEQMAEVN